MSLISAKAYNRNFKIRIGIGDSKFKPLWRQSLIVYLSNSDLAALLNTTLTGMVLDGSMIAECGRCTEGVMEVFISGVTFSVMSRVSSSVK